MDFVRQCENVAVIDSYTEEIRIQCRREHGHEGNHSTNAFNDVVTMRGEDKEPVVFRLDWRRNDGIVYTRYPKREDKRD